MNHLDSLDQCLAWIEQLHYSEIELGLSRVRQVADRLALLSPDSTVVTVAGTNGKGSATAMIEAMAIQQGKTVGCYTSPHIFVFNERIRVNGQNVSDAEIVAAFKTIEAGRGDVSLTYFEYTTLAALLIFKAKRLDLVVLEVGLGGRLDAVNIIDADFAVITSIGLDHQDWLGNTREEIAIEKLGILRLNQKVVITEPRPPANMASLLSDSGAYICRLDQEISARLSPDSLNLCLASGAEYTLPLPKHLSVESYIAAFQIAEFLEIDITELDADQLAKTTLLGRFQLAFIDGKNVILDVAHNPDAIERLVDRLIEHYADASFAICYATMSDKDYVNAIGLLDKLNPDCWYLPTLDVSRALPAEQLQSAINTKLPKANCKLTDIEGAIRSLPANQHLLICGSFYTVAAGLGLIENVKG